MRAGELDQRITIQSPTSAPGSTGEEIISWGDWKTVWASVLQVSGGEKWVSPQIVAESSHKIKMRYISGISTSYRVIWRGRTLNITSVDDSRRRQGELYLFCKEDVVST